MARFVLRGSLFTNILPFRKILIVAVCALASGWLQTPIALAQRGGGRMGGGAGRFGTAGRVGAPGGFVPRTTPVFVPRSSPGPRSSPAPFWRVRGVAGPRPAGTLPRAFGFAPRPAFWPSRFFGPPFRRFGFGFGFDSFWWSGWWPGWGLGRWPGCGAYFGWGFNCYGWPYYGWPYAPYYGYGFESFNYFYPQPYYSYPLYAYSGEGRDLPQLILKDGTVYSVTDYWFKNGQVHFTMLDESGTQTVEYVIGFDELDVQKTIEANTRRGFRFVLRDAPVEQYLRDHPDLSPAPAPPPQN